MSLCELLSLGVMCLLSRVVCSVDGDLLGQ